MRARSHIWLFVLLAGLALLLPGTGGAQSSETVPSIELSGTVDPATEAWVGSALDQAADDDAPLAIIRLDTPGGLESSMREIVQDILEAPMPVVVYVAPNGARAASAGAFVTEAADVAAMAPQTNIGSASAIQSNGEDIGGTLGVKIENDAAAFIRALAESHGRDGTLPELMVTEAENVTAAEALEAGAIDIVAESEQDLLAQLDGFEVQGPKQATLATAGLRSRSATCPCSYQVLQILVNPTVAYLLLLVGLVGIAIEVFSPGLIIPGTFGVVSFLLGAYGTAQLPVTAVGHRAARRRRRADHRRGPPRHARDRRRRGGGRARRVGAAAVQHRLERVRGLGAGRDRRRGRCSAAGSCSWSRRRSRRAASRRTPAARTWPGRPATSACR